MGHSSLNWVDKTILALSKFGPGKNTYYDAYPIKIAMAVSLALNIGGMIGILRHMEVIEKSLEVPEPYWIVGLLSFAVCYVPIHLMTHSAKTIFSSDLTRIERWIYTTIGFLLLGSWGLLLIWPVPMLLSS